MRMSNLVRLTFFVKDRDPEVRAGHFTYQHTFVIYPLKEVCAISIILLLGIRLCEHTQTEILHYMSLQCV